MIYTFVRIFFSISEMLTCVDLFFFRILRYDYLFLLHFFIFYYTSDIYLIILKNFPSVWKRAYVMEHIKSRRYFANERTCWWQCLVFLHRISCNELKISTFQTDSFTAVLNIIIVSSCILRRQRDQPITIV